MNKMCGDIIICIYVRFVMYIYVKILLLIGVICNPEVMISKFDRKNLTEHSCISACNFSSCGTVFHIRIQFVVKELYAFVDI